MSTVEEIKSAIVSLSQEEYKRLRVWFTERDWKEWDREIERDSSSGKLNFLMEEAVTQKNQGRLKKF